MSPVSRTGLRSSPNPISEATHKSSLYVVGRNLPHVFEGVGMPLSLHPFGGYVKPFRTSCSLLCNHPAPADIKNLIHEVKQSVNKSKRHLNVGHEGVEMQMVNESIPDELFNRYTDTDSRPLTPTFSASNTHAQPSISSFLNNRRCVTPEWDKMKSSYRKKIILDLRKSHSQDILTWRPSEYAPTPPPPAHSAALARQHVEHAKAGTRAAKDSEEKQLANGSEQASNCLMTTKATTDEAGHDTDKADTFTCINEHALNDKARRGKARKKLKAATTGATSGPVTVSLHNEEPETQVEALGPDSLNGSNRNSLVPGTTSLLKAKPHPNDLPSVAGSFLTEDVLEVLKTKLDIDIIENTFGRYLNCALREAYETIQPTCKPDSSMASIQYTPKHAKNGIPRKLSKSGNRFDIPLNLKTQQSITVLDYLSNYVWVSQQRKKLYKRIFLDYIQTSTTELLIDAPPATSVAQRNHPTDQPSTMPMDRTLMVAKLPDALRAILEFYGTEKNIGEVLRLIDFDQMQEPITFRTWCGIAALAERISLEEPDASSSCDELEESDFSILDECLQGIELSKELHEVFGIIKRGHRRKPVARLDEIN